MNPFILIVAYLLIGIILGRLPFADQAGRVLNSLVITLFLPGLILHALPKITFTPVLLVLSGTAWVIFLVSILFFVLLGFFWKWDRSIIGTLILCAGLGNTSFVGFPIIEAMFGQKGLGYAIVIDQTGSFPILSSLGVLVGAICSGKTFDVKLLRRFLFFPPLIAFALSILLVATGAKIPPLIDIGFDRLGSLVAPFALISIGTRLKFSGIKEFKSHLAWGLTFKLLLAPALISGYYTLLALPAEMKQVGVMESGMGPMATSVLLAISYNLHPRLAGLMLAVGIPLSFLTLAGWYQFLTT